MSKSKRRRLRKSKQNSSKQTKSNIYVDTISNFTLNYVKNIVLSVYIKDITKHIDGNIPIDEIKSLCSNFYGEMKPNKLYSSIPKILQNVFEKDKLKLSCHCCGPRRYPGVDDYISVKTRRFRFNTHFNQLPEYMKRLACKRILIDKKYKIHSISFFPDDQFTLQKQFKYLQYILLKGYKTVQKLDLSQMNVTDNDIVALCNIIENIINYQREKAKQNIVKDNKSKNKKVNIQMHLHEINFSLNSEITDKHVALLLRTVKKYLPMMQHLYLASTNVSNKSITTIMKYNITNMKVHLTDCKRVTLKGLNKYLRGDYEDDPIEKYVYCKKLIYFANTYEDKVESSNDRQAYVGNNKSKKWKRRK